MADREKVIASLKACAREDVTVLCSDAGCPYWDEDNCTGKMARDALELLKKRETVSGWVSVKDRLPEKKCECLIVINSGWRALDFWEGDGWAVSDENEITHWMPLPEPPKEVSVDG